MSLYKFIVATSRQHIDDYFALRRAIFAEEQQLFAGDDRDQIDKIAYPIVAISTNNQVVGVVRIYEIKPQVWYGGRLGTHQDYRKKSFLD